TQWDRRPGHGEVTAPRRIRRPQERRPKMALLPYVWVHQARPGRGGQSPPRLSMASAMSASGERNPNATRVSRRILADLGVDRLDTGVGELLGEGGLDAGSVAGDLAGQLDERGDAAAARPPQRLSRPSLDLGGASMA